MQSNAATQTPSFGRFVESCAAYGIGRSHAYQLAREGLLHPFRIGRAAYIYFADIESLPERLREAA